MPSPSTAVRQLGHLAGDLIVGLPREVQAVDQPAVGIEVPVAGTLVALAVDDVGGPRVAEPGVVGGHLDDGHILIVLENGLAVGVIVLVGAHDDRRELGDGPSDGSVLLLSRLGAMGPGVGAMGPAYPHAILRGELGGHEETVGGGGRVRLVNSLHGEILSE